MSIASIDGALIAAYIAIGQGLATSYEGANFIPPASADWAKVTIDPSSTAPASSWISGEDEHLGFMQIDYKTRPGAGRAALLTYAQAAMTAFPAGKSFTRSGQHVTIQSASRSRIRQDEDGMLTISVTVNWKALTNRPEI